MIKTIIFDLGGVYFTDGTKHAIKKISSKYNLSGTEVGDVLFGKLGTEYRISKITRTEFWKKAKQLWNIEENNDVLSRLWIEEYRQNLGVVKIIDKLRNAGYELLYLSDNVKERIDFLENRNPFLFRFKDGITSFQARTRKPDPKIYELVLKKSTHPPEECIYIDDKAELLEPAKKLGMHVILFKNPKQLEKALKDAGLEII